jgi:hypothetical protein
LGGTLTAVATADGSTTTFISSDFDDYPADFFNKNWLMKAGATCENVSAGFVVDITDFVESTKTFTTTTADGAWADGDVVTLIYTLNMSGEGITSSKAGIAPTAASDSIACFTANGNIWLLGLQSEVTTVMPGVTDSVRFLIDAATGTSVVRIDKGEEANAAAVGTIYAVNSATLGTATAKSTEGAPLPVAVWRLLITDGSVIEFFSAGAGTTGRFRADCLWLPAEEDAALTSN